jgi:hypothetical protein
LLWMTLKISGGRKTSRVTLNTCSRLLHLDVTRAVFA